MAGILEHPAAQEPLRAATLPRGGQGLRQRLQPPAALLPFLRSGQRADAAIVPRGTPPAWDARPPSRSPVTQAFPAGPSRNPSAKPAGPAGDPGK